MADAGIKVSRIPFAIYYPGEPGSEPQLASDGDLGLVFAGSSSSALMTKEALAEVVRKVQGIPGYHDTSIGSIADLLFRGFKIVTRSIASAIFEGVATTVIFAGWCTVENRLRAFRMSVDRANQHAIDEVLQAVGDYEVIGSGTKAARNRLSAAPTTCSFINVLQKVIDDPTVEGVGGNIQYGDFDGRNFQPAGVARLDGTGTGVHYFRGLLDLNGNEFDQDKGLLPRFPYLDLIQDQI